MIIDRTNNHTAYRPDIDGLRAIAVLSVIVFHLDKDFLPGGFVGVDIFFVISGFLITRNILEELSSHSFSVVDFYRRRIKRIAPALLVVVAATLVCAQFILLPESASAVAHSAVWSLASLANVYFWKHLDTTYFAPSTAEVPLLHLWSLGIEEQFYLLWPLLLTLSFRARHFSLIYGVIALVSITAAQLLFPYAPKFVFYMLPTRAGELLTGAIVASGAARGHYEALSPRATSWISIAGALLIGVSLAQINEANVIPGLLVVPPILGTALIIIGGRRGTVVSRILSQKPVVAIGLISYSAYLWHWPILALYRYGHDRISLAAGLLILASTLGLAWLSYRFIEQPARAAKGTWKRVLVTQYIIPAAAIGVLAVIAAKLEGYGMRHLGHYKDTLAKIRSERWPAYKYEYVCQRQRLTAADAINPLCVVGKISDEEPTAVLWGDSTAAHYVGLVGAFARAGGYRVRDLAHSACPPIDGDPGQFVDARFREDCRASLEVARSLVEKFPIVIISATWDSYQTHAEDFMRKFFDTVQRLVKSGKRVILIAKAPEIAGYDPLCGEKALSYPFLSCEHSTALPSMEVLRVNAALQSFAARTTGVTYYEATEYLCPAGNCHALNESGEPIYYDKMHLTMTASWALGERILREHGLPSAFAFGDVSHIVARAAQ